ncbi:MAG: hypothetical protein ABIS50_06600 [Luteolibacter sp.]|uniref:hypothetical protein n=1 Tax=Luteolibacter sp. TaxID=1962973 RepID=UPI003267B5A1
MSKNDYIAPADPGFSTQLATFKNSVGGYKTVLGLTPAQVTEQAADADYFAYNLTTGTVVQNAASQWSAWKKIMREGGTPPPSGAPVPPVFPAAIPDVAAGIETRFRNLVRLIKANPAYNEAMGKALGIEGTEKGGPDLSTLAPELTATLEGGQVKIAWGWQGHGSHLDLIEIQVDRGAGYVLLTYDSTPGYIDTAPFPAAPAKWSYKAIYRVGDSQVGQWSAEVFVTVGG